MDNQRGVDGELGMNVKVRSVHAVDYPKGAEHKGDIRGVNIRCQLRRPQPLRRVSDEHFAREQIVNLIGSLNQLVAAKAEDARVRRLAVLEKGGRRVAEDNELLS